MRGVRTADTTNLVESWVNTAIAEGLGRHRGMRLSQKKMLVSIILSHLTREKLTPTFAEKKHTKVPLTRFRGEAAATFETVQQSVTLVKKIAMLNEWQLHSQILENLSTTLYFFAQSS